MVEVKDKRQAFQEDQESSAFKRGAGGGDYVWVKVERGTEQKRGGKIETIAETSRPLIRGQEYWNVSYATRLSWQLFRLRFESTAFRGIGRIELAYTRAILPEARWDSFESGPFSGNAAREYKHKLLEILKRSSDSAEEGRIEVPETADELMPLGLPNVPEWAHGIVNSHELLALRQRRAYVNISSTTLQDMYVKADFVRAVILQSYLERLLDQGGTDFLKRGRIVHRLVAFPDPAAELRLTDQSRQVYREFLSGFLPPSRILRRVDCPGSFEGLVPVYDFAIIKDGDGERVFVAHGVSETSVIDIASPQRTAQTYRVEGYLSWRTADVRFYSALFEWLASQSKEMGTPDDRTAMTTASEGAA
jgi:hypothetical protein